MTIVLRRLAVGAVLLLLLSMFVTWWSANMRLREAQRNAPVLLAAAQPMPVAAARSLASRLAVTIAATPLDQDVVNRYYALAVANRLWTSRQHAAWGAQLGALGWRSTAAQQNILYEAAMRGDFATLLDRADAMLRRDKLIPELMAVMAAVEQAPETHDRLVARLEANATWRRGFLTDPRGTATAEGREARRATIVRMLDHRAHVERDEIAPLVAADGTDKAYALWTRYRSTNGSGVPRGGASFDPDFVAYVATQRRESPAVIPFEWQPLSTDSATADIDASGVTLRWDGFGVPILLRQTLRAAPSRYLVTLRGADAAPDLLNKFDISLDCGEQQIRFIRPRAGPAGQLSVETNEPVPCRFPTLVVRGHPGLMANAVEAVLTTIASRPVGLGG